MNNTGMPNQTQKIHQESSNFEKNSEMSEDMDKDVVKYTLQSYIGSHVVSCSEEKKIEAVKKMENLPRENFDELVRDIVNEIHRRCDMAYDESDKPMREKLIKLRDDKFKNLAYDVLTVFNNRYFKNSKSDIKDEINNLGKLISLLKVEEETGEEIISETNEKIKFKLFVEYVKRFHNDKIVEYMENFVKESIEKDLNNNFQILFNYKKLIHKIDNSKYKNLKEYQFYKSNIKRIERMNIDGKIRKNLLMKEFLNISELLYNNQFYYEEGCVRDDVNHLINIIARYNSNLTKEKSFLNEVHTEIIEVVNKIIERADSIDYINKNILKRLQGIVDLNKTCISDPRIEYDEFVIEISKTVRELLENINR